MLFVKFPKPPERSCDAQDIASGVQRWNASGAEKPDATVVIPVNAQGDLGNVRQIIADLADYSGQHRLELILVVNNFPPGEPPAEIAELEALGAKVVAIPNVRRPGEAVGFSARIPGVTAARCEPVLLFDADCRIPNPTALIDWYVRQFQAGAAAAYTGVGYYNLLDVAMVEARMLIHYSARWVKRNIFGIPTTRGSNYAVTRSRMLEYYKAGYLADEMNVGPTFKRMGGRVVYGSHPSLMVLTSGRMYKGKSWRKMARHFIYRLRYNLRVLPVRKDVVSHTGRENDPVRKYENNHQVP